MNILFVGPLPPPTHGQSVAFEEAYFKTHANKFVVNQNFENKLLFNKIISTSLSLIKITYFLFFKKIDIIYFTCSRSKFGSTKDIYLLSLANILKIKVVNHLHGADFHDFYEQLGSVYKRILHWSYANIDTSIVLLPSMQNQFLNTWPDMNIEIIANFYSSELDVINKKNKHETIELLYLSNLLASKGILDLLDAVSILDEHDINYRLSIAGAFLSDDHLSSKEIEKEFRKQIQDNTNITYLGTIHGDKKVETLEKSDIFLLPTYYKTEAFPISILEAMRAGNVIITTNHNYLPEVVNENMGTLIPIKSPKSIFMAIKKYIENRRLLKKVQDYNIAYSKKHYSSDKFINHLNQVFESVMKK